MTIDNPLGADELSALSASLAKENASADPIQQLSDLWLFGRGAHLLQLDTEPAFHAFKLQFSADGQGLLSALEAGQAGNPIQLGTAGDDFIAPPYPTPPRSRPTVSLETTPW